MIVFGCESQKGAKQNTRTNGFNCTPIAKLDPIEAVPPECMNPLPESPFPIKYKREIKKKGLVDDISKLGLKQGIHSTCTRHGHYPLAVVQEEREQEEGIRALQSTTAPLAAITLVLSLLVSPPFHKSPFHLPS